MTNKLGNMALINTDTGEINGNVAGFWSAQEVDNTKFVKLFVNGVKALKGLSSAGTKVFEVLFSRIQENIGKDEVFMSYLSVDQSLYSMSHPTYDRGMRELIKGGFIAAKKVQGWYWINPAYVWNGDKIAFVHEYRREARRKKVTDTKTIDMFPERD